MGSPEYFREIEDEKRRDSAEGLGEIQENVKDVATLIVSANGIIKKVETGPGTVQIRTEIGNCIYILCCSGPDADIGYIKEKFGKHIIKIKDLTRLARRVTAWFRCKRMPLAGDAVWCQVRYDKGSTVLGPFSRDEYDELSYCQKEPKYSKESEYRLVVLTASHPYDYCCETMKVDLGGSLEEYVEYLF